MASLRQEILIEAPAEVVWDVLRDVGAVHRRLLPGRVVAIARPMAASHWYGS